MPNSLLEVHVTSDVDKPDRSSKSGHHAVSPKSGALGKKLWAMRTDQRLADGPSQVKRHRQQIMFSLKGITNDSAFQVKA
jgi:hypothetical protein